MSTISSSAGPASEDAVLVTTAGTGLYGLDVAGGYIAGESVVVIGPGPVGLMTVQVCKALGADQVILLGTRDARLELGRKLGADLIRTVHGVGYSLENVAVALEDVDR